MRISTSQNKALKIVGPDSKGNNPHLDNTMIKMKKPNEDIR